MPDIEIQYLPVNAQTRIPLLTNGTIDIECGSTTNNLARQQQVDFTYSFYVTGGRLLASKASGIKEIEDLNGKAVGVAPGTSNERTIKDADRREEARTCGSSTCATMPRACWRSRPTASTPTSTTRSAQFALLAKSTQSDRFDVVGRLLSFDPVRPDDPPRRQRLQGGRQPHAGDDLPLGRGLSDVQEALRPVRHPDDAAVDWTFKLNAMPD